jgi:hypothetical protein
MWLAARRRLSSSGAVQMLEWLQLRGGHRDTDQGVQHHCRPLIRQECHFEKRPLGRWSERELARRADDGEVDRVQREADPPQALKYEDHSEKPAGQYPAEFGRRIFSTSSVTMIEKAASMRPSQRRSSRRVRTCSSPVSSDDAISCTSFTASSRRSGIIRRRVLSRRAPR